MNTKILVRYLLRQNLFLLALVLGAGLGIYLLIELFDRLDDFLKAGVGLTSILVYFAAKTPLIISQIVPAVFLLSLLIQFSLMHRNREIIALSSCAVPFAVPGRIMLVYALIWSALLFGFSQILGTKGYTVAHRIWKEEVRKHQLSQQTLWDVWFREADRMIRIKRFKPFQGVGEGVVMYTLTKDGRGMETITTASSVQVRGTTWKLTNVRHIHLTSFARETIGQMALTLGTDPRSFATLTNDKAPQYLSYWELARVIKVLGQAGSNVEGLRTSLYAKISYPCSLVVLVCAAVAITLTITNIYASVLAGLGLIFLYYVMFAMSTAAGENGTLAPIVAAWLPNLVFGAGGIGILGIRAFCAQGVN